MLDQKRLELKLQKLKDEGLYRVLKVFEGDDKARMSLENRELLLFSSNDYLGLASDPELRKASIEAINRYGCGSGASRLVSGTLKLHKLLERRVAYFKRKESALVFNSGFAANTAVISTLMGKGDLILSDRLNHASILEGIRLSRATLIRYHHCDYLALEKLLKEYTGGGQILIVTDGIFSMDGDMAPLKEISDLSKKYNAMLMVDDAHGTGTIGKYGRGVAEHFGVEDDVDIHMGTFSKAIGSSGGFIAAGSPVIDFLCNKAPGFIYTTSLPPSVIAASVKGLELVNSKPELKQRLKSNASYLRGCLLEKKFDIMNSETQIIPIVTGDARETTRASEVLLEKGLYIPAIRPPTVPKGKGRLRVSVSAAHTRTELNIVIDLLTETGIERGLI